MTCRAAALSFFALAAAAAAQQPESRPASAPAADRITFELVAPAPESRPAGGGAQRPVAVIRITNERKEAVTIWPLVEIRIRDANGEDLKPSSSIGRWGRRREPCFLEAVKFVTVEPGRSVEWPVRLERYVHDPGAIVGWKLKPGEYTVTARWSFSREEFVGRCKLGCESHADPKRPWNLALEVRRDATLAVQVK
jgi:hypothetical protein